MKSAERFQLTVEDARLLLGPVSRRPASFDTAPSPSLFFRDVVYCLHPDIHRNLSGQIPQCASGVCAALQGPHNGAEDCENTDDWKIEA